MRKRKATHRHGTCLDCKQEKRLVTTTACGKCYRLLRAPRIKCASCGSTDYPRNGTNTEGQPVCARCYSKFGFRPRTKCSHCGSLDGVHHGTTSDGKPVCLNCYTRLKMRPKITCANCQSQNFAQHGRLPDGRGICEGCYTKLDLRPKRLCTNCGVTDRPQHGTTAEGGAVCELCYNRLGLRPTLLQCENCGEKDQLRGGTTVDGKPVCQKCYHKLGLQPCVRCAECGSDRHPRCGQNQAGQAVCEHCYNRLRLRPNTQCSSCGSDQRPRKGSTQDGKALCANCYKPYPCGKDDCQYMASGPSQLAQHQRTHGPWRWRSVMEEWTYSQLESHGLKQSWPYIDPEEGPEPGHFWFNARVFSGLRGVGGKRLECDFMVCLDNTRLLWVELQGKQHYVPWALASLSLADIQEHDRRRREFATEKLPQQGTGWAHITFHEIPYFEFHTHFKSWFSTLLSDMQPGEHTLSSMPVDSKRRKVELDTTRTNRTIDDFYPPVSSTDFVEVPAQL